MNNEGNNNLNINDINLTNNAQNNLNLNNQVTNMNSIQNMQTIMPNEQSNNIPNLVSNGVMSNNIMNIQENGINISNNKDITTELQNLNNNSFNNTGDNNIVKQSKGKNKKLIIVLIILIIILVLLLVMVGVIKFFGGDLENDKVVNAGQLLKVEELNNQFAFNVDVLEDMEIKEIDNMFYKGKCIAIKVFIKNNSADVLSFFNIKVSFKLLDFNDDVIFELSPFIAFKDEGSIQAEIPSGESATGYLYFYDIIDESRGANIDISKVSKLKIDVVKEESYVDDNYSADFENYYIKFK